MIDMNRREFVTAAAACAACIVCGHGADQAEAASGTGPVDAGELKSFAKDGVTSTYAQTGGFLLVRRNGRLYAVSTICTHKQQRVGMDPAHAGQFRCPKHGSVFSLEGKVLKGPAAASLQRLGISVNETQHVIVDTARKLSEQEWDNTGAYVTV
jgi:Rieske Fe-S protein